MAFRIAPWWWPVFTAASPIIVPLCLVKNRRFHENRARVERVNEERIAKAEPLDLPELDFLELTVLVEWRAKPGFLGDAGVSYLFRSDRGAILFDVGFGPTRISLAHNAARLGVTLQDVDALVISHLHPDHMGGLKASRSGRVLVPAEMGPPDGKPCFLPDEASAAGFSAEVVREPRILAAGLGTTGPLARSLFFMGWTEEQALIARVKDKGLVVFSGCGHPTIEVILRMVRRLSDEPLYVVGGGLHFPVTRGRGSYAGIQVQTLLGTGKPPWQRISEEDLQRTIASINEAAPSRVYLSAHDTCDYALDRFQAELKSNTLVVKAGEVYRM